MIDLTRKGVLALLDADPTISKSQRAGVVAILDGKAPVTEPVPRVYSPAETSKLFGVTTKQVRVWAANGKLERVKPGPKAKRGIGYTEASVRALAEGRGRYKSA